ncbi:MAG TPA: ketol-acid reductoisomerase [Chloroflexota bacterium]|nr:ketol-acid reductoisomerase [Chloroflexota bacterium]
MTGTAEAGATVYRDGDVDLELIRARRIGIIGYGAQGRAHALNLRDSGCQVHVGARPDGAGARRAAEDGFDVDTVANAAAWSDLISVLLPDQVHRQIVAEEIGPQLATGDLLLFAHGFSVHFGQVVPPDGVDVALVAPVGPGTTLRRLYVEDSGIPAVLAVHTDASGRAFDVGLAYAGALGCARVGILPTTFAEETETDLFGEQAVICGGVSALIRAGFDTLVANGYQPELAYFECLHQMKLIVDLIHEGGLAYMHSLISDTAAFGDFSSGPRVMDDHARAAMQGVLDDIRNGSFARAWIEEAELGAPNLRRAREAEHGEFIETVGSKLRSMMRR